MSILREVFVKLGLEVDDKSFAEGIAKLNETVEAAKKVTEALREMGKASTESMKDIAKAIDDVSKASSEPIKNVADSINKIGKASSEPIKNVADSVHKIQKTHSEGFEKFKKNIIEIGKASWEGIKVVAEAVEVIGKGAEGVKNVVEAFRELGKTSSDGIKDVAETIQDIGKGAEGIKNVVELVREISKTSSAPPKKVGEPVHEIGNDSSDGIKDVAEAVHEISKSSETLRNVARAVSEIGKTSAEPIQKVAATVRAIGKTSSEGIQKVAEAVQEISKSSAPLQKVAEAVLAVSKSSMPLQKVAQAIKEIGEAAKPVLPVVLDIVKAITQLMTANKEVGVEAVIHGISGAFKLFRPLLDGVTAAFAEESVVSIAAAAETAAAWIAAAAPFVALAALIGGFLYTYNAVKTYWDDLKKGVDTSHTAIGRLDRQMKDFMKPHGDDPWWLSAIRSTVGHLEKGIQLLGILSHSNDHATLSVRDTKFMKENNLTEQQFMNKVQGDPTSRWAAKYRAFTAGAGAWGQLNAEFNPFSQYHAPTAGGVNAFETPDQIARDKRAMATMPGYTLRATGYVPGAAGFQSPLEHNTYHISIDARGMDASHLPGILDDHLAQKGYVGKSDLEAAHAASGARP